jgi:hypothetical protein
MLTFSKNYLAVPYFLKKLLAVIQLEGKKY